MTNKNHLFCVEGKRHPTHNLRFTTEANLLAGVGEVNGTPLDSTQLRQFAVAEDTDAIYALVGVAPLVWLLVSRGFYGGTPVAMRSITVTETIPAKDAVVGSADLGLFEGCAYYLLVEHLSGVCDDADVELAVTAFGSPTPIYQIGQNDLGEPRWKPSTDGNWIDQNAWGFRGLSSGLLYYRFTNNDLLNALEIRLSVYVNGVI